MRKPELPALTGIRFYAATLAFLSHVTLIPGTEHFSKDYLIFNVGVVGVSFFFVLSGFVLTYNYAHLFDAAIPARHYRLFVWDRLTKIYPVHLLALILVLPVALYSPNKPLDWHAIPVHLTLTQCWWPAPYPEFREFLNVPSWSISCEWLFYLLAPALIFFVIDGRRRWIPLIAMGVYAAFGVTLLSAASSEARLFFVSWFAPSRVAEFLVGVFLARRFLGSTVVARAWTGPVAQIAGLLLIALAAVYRAHAPWPLWGGLLYVPGSALLVWSLGSGHGIIARHLGSLPLRRLGTASYSFYLLHAPLLRTLKGAMLHFGWSTSTVTGFAVAAALAFVCIQGLAMFVCYGYELPLQSRLRRLFRQRTEAPLALATQFGA